MKKIVKENLQLKQFTTDRNFLISFLLGGRKEILDLHQATQIDLILFLILSEMPEDEEISFYQQGEYLEMCAGPHVAYTSAIKAFKLLSF